MTRSIPYWRKVHLQDSRKGWVAREYIEPLSSPTLVGPPSTIPGDAWLEVNFVDVGHGDGIWIHTYDDGIDGNGIFEGRSVIIP